MLKNYLKIAWRNLLRNKTYTIINIIGLSVGIASCILILLFIQDELSYDEFHDNADRIYRVYDKYTHNNETGKSLATAMKLAPELEKDIPGIKSAVRLSNRYYEVLVKTDTKSFYEDNFYFVDQSFLDLFNFELLRGNPDQVLNEPFTVVITEEMAHKYFGDKNPIGKVLKIDGLWGPDEFEVTGVLENGPHNSHISINFLSSLQTQRKVEPSPEETFNSWHHVGSYTYVLLEKGVNPEDLTSQLENFLQNHQGKKAAKFNDYKLQPVTDIHLYSHFEDELEQNSNPKYLYIFGSAALLLLIIACINYVNLATARSMDRAMEVGIRKTLGVSRTGLVIQFLSETLIYVAAAIGLALVLTESALPYFNELVGKPLSFSVSEPWFLASLLVLLLLISGLAGLYPAAVLSRFNPHTTLSKITGGIGKSAARNSLVVIQFALSIALIIGTLTINRQLQHLRTKPLGINTENVLSIRGDFHFRNSYKPFEDRLRSHSDIVNVTNANTSFPLPRNSGLSLEPSGLDSRNIPLLSIGDNFLQTLDIKLLKGRDATTLQEEIKSDSSNKTYGPVLINEAAVQKWGWNEPLGKTLGGFRPTLKVVGVVENFNFTSLKQGIQPLVMSPNLTAGAIMVRIKEGEISETLSFIRKTWDEMGPNAPFEYDFLDDKYKALYKSEDKMAGVFEGFTFLAVFLACLGLFGLSVFSAEKRTKEIGIRKVLGATKTDIVFRLCKDILKPVFIGFILAVPVAWYFSHQWLKNFAYKINIDASIFLLAGSGAVLIAFITVIWQSLKSARLNPAEAVRMDG